LHDLIPLDPALPALGMLTEAEVDATMAYAQAEKATSTREAYAADWRDFAAWCASRGATALPAHMCESASKFDPDRTTLIPLKWFMVFHSSRWAIGFQY